MYKITLYVYRRLENVCEPPALFVEQGKKFSYFELLLLSLGFTIIIKVYNIIILYIMYMRG